MDDDRDPVNQWESEEYIINNVRFLGFFMSIIRQVGISLK